MISKTTLSAGMAMLMQIALTAPAVAATPITFDPDGLGLADPINVTSFDWIQDSVLVVGGNPASGLQTDSLVTILTHGKLGVMNKVGGGLAAMPAGTELTFVAGFAERVTVGATGVSFEFDSSDSNRPNFFEIWVGPVSSDPLLGSGYNGFGGPGKKRILFGAVTGSEGSFGVIASPLPLPPLDQFDNGLGGAVNNYPGITTLVGIGSTQLAGVIISADDEYFPGLTPAKIADLRVFFNTNTATPYTEQDPSANFVGDDAGADGSAPPSADVAANIGPQNGVPQPPDELNFVTQSDANNAFELGEEVPGACRVTYGGNDRNGNIDLKKFGEACSRDKGKSENCYTFGGQVGAPTANPALGGPFGEHTHHQVQGPAGDFVFHAGSRSAPKTTRITATACKDPGAIRQAEANAGFKQIDFEGTGSFRALSAEAKAYLHSKGGPSDIATDNMDDRKYYFRVDMVDAGEPGNQASKKKFDQQACRRFYDADQNNPLSTDDPLLTDYVGTAPGNGGVCADLYQFYICPSEDPCEEDLAMYKIRAFLTGGNIQLHKVVK